MNINELLMNELNSASMESREEVTPGLVSGPMMSDEELEAVTSFGGEADVEYQKTMASLEVLYSLLAETENTATLLKVENVDVTKVMQHHNVITNGLVSISLEAEDDSGSLTDKAKAAIDTVIKAIKKAIKKAGLQLSKLFKAVFGSASMIVKDAQKFQAEVKEKNVGEWLIAKETKISTKALAPLISEKGGNVSFLKMSAIDGRAISSLIAAGFAKTSSTEKAANEILEGKETATEYMLGGMKSRANQYPERELVDGKMGYKISLAKDPVAYLQLVLEEGKESVTFRSTGASIANFVMGDNVTASSSSLIALSEDAAELAKSSARSKHLDELLKLADKLDGDDATSSANAKEAGRFVRFHMQAIEAEMRYAFALAKAMHAYSRAFKPMTAE